MQKNIGVTEALLALTPTAQFAVRDDDYEKIEWYSDDINQPSKKDVEEKIKELRASAPLQSLREIRNWLLVESDWTQGYDIRLIRGPEWCEAWDKYRQELRDITSQNLDLSFNDMGVLIGFELPVKPKN